MVEARLGKTETAIQHFREIIAITPNDAEAHLNLGIALADHLDLEGALVEFSEAVQLRPDSSALHYNKGRCLLDLRRNDQAKTELETAIRQDPGNSTAMYLLAVADKQLGDIPASAEVLERALSLDPNNADAQYLLGQNLAKIGKEKDAILHWRRAVELNPENGEALYNLARHLTRADPAEAERYQARFVDLQKKRHITERADTLGNFALAAASARDWTQAIAQLREALQVCGDCQSKGDLHKNLGLIYCRSGDLANGEQELKIAQGIKPDDRDVKRSLELVAELKSSRVRK
jgi:tetratricopeptide (TPR) repeat protein